MTKFYSRRIQAAIACILFFASCQCGKQASPKVHNTRVSFKLDFVDSTFHVVSFSDSVDILSYKDYTIYIKLAPHDYWLTDSMPDGTLYNKTQLNSSPDTNYYVFHNADSMGLNFSSVNDGAPVTLSKRIFFGKDSFADEMRLYQPKSENIIRSGMHGDTLVEVSVPTVSDPSFSDTTFFYLVKDVNDKPYTFSAALEKLRGKKLVKVVSNWLPYYDSSLHHMIPARQFLFSRTDFDMDEEIAKKAVAYFTAHEELLKKPAGIMNKE